MDWQCLSQLKKNTNITFGLLVKNTDQAVFLLPVALWPFHRYAFKLNFRNSAAPSWQGHTLLLLSIVAVIHSMCFKVGHRQSRHKYVHRSFLCLITDYKVCTWLTDKIPVSQDCSILKLRLMEYINLNFRILQLPVRKMARVVRWAEDSLGSLSHLCTYLRRANFPLLKYKLAKLRADNSVSHLASVLHPQAGRWCPVSNVKRIN